MTTDDNTKWLFGGENGDNGQWEAHRRFISESYNPIYRQGVVSAHHLSEAAFAEFLRGSRTDPATASATFVSWVQTNRPQGGDYGDVAMERIAARAPSFDAETSLGIVTVFASVMDDYYRLRPKREMFVDIWEKSEGILRTFRTSVPDFEFGRIASRLAREGEALAWLTAAIGRSELWDHGLVGDRPKEDAVHLLRQPELREYFDELVRRLHQLSASELLTLPRLGRVLFAVHDSPWHADESRMILRRLAGPRVTDARFLAFMEAMSGVVISSDRGVYHTLSVKSLHALLGEAEFDRRWGRIVSKALAPDLEARKAVIMTMISEAKDW